MEAYMSALAVLYDRAWIKRKLKKKKKKTDWNATY